jgi:hypothetical protein
MKDFIGRYKYYIITGLILLTVFTIFLIVTSEGPQQGAFQYQIF